MSSLRIGGRVWDGAVVEKREGLTVGVVDVIERGSQRLGGRPPTLIFTDAALDIDGIFTGIAMDDAAFDRR